MGARGITSTSTKVAGTKVAVTSMSSVIVSSHGPVPVQSPLHPVKRVDDVSVAVRVIFSPPPNDAAQTAPQSIAPVASPTAPLPASVTWAVQVLAGLHLSESA